jgi:hypothetical protein
LRLVLRSGDTAAEQQPDREDARISQRAPPHVSSFPTDAPDRRGWAQAAGTRSSPGQLPQHVA